MMPETLVLKEEQHLEIEGIKLVDVYSKSPLLICIGCGVEPLSLCISDDTGSL